MGSLVTVLLLTPHVLAECCSCVGTLCTARLVCLETLLWGVARPIEGTSESSWPVEPELFAFLELPFDVILNKELPFPPRTFQGEVVRWLHEVI